MSDSRKQTNNNWIVAALILGTVRLICRTIFVVLTESAIGIPLICCAMLSFPILLYLWRSGGYQPIVLYFLIEIMFATLYWMCFVFLMDTNEVCQKLNDGVCEELDHVGLL